MATNMATVASKLREAANRGQYGHRRSPRNFYIGGSYCEYYWSHCTDLCSFDEWRAMARLSARYRRYVDYVENVAPGWAEVRQIHWADNSIDSVQRSRDGRERTVQIDGPHGDVCF